MTRIKQTIWIAFTLLLLSSCNDMISHDCSENNGVVEDIILPDTVLAGKEIPIEIAYGYSSSGSVTSINYQFEGDSLILSAFYCITTREGYVSNTEYHYDTLLTKLTFPTEGKFNIYIKDNNDFLKTVVVK